MDHNQASLLDHKEVANVLETNLSGGLNSIEAGRRLTKYGLNRLADEDESMNTVQKYIHQNIIQFLKQFLNPLIQLLLICVLVSAVIGEYANSISVVVSILIVCTISFIQERRADKSLEKLNKQMPNNCQCLREGQKVDIRADYLVPGDIVYLNEGQRVPADVRLFDTYAMSVNEADLTGENQSQAKVSQPLGNKKMSSALSGPVSAISFTLESERAEFIFQNLALMGTLVESGHSKGIVICTGRSTRYGEVFSMLKSTVQPRSPLQNNIYQLSIHLVVISCIIIAAMSIVGILQRRPALEVAYYALSLAVTAIPEGLPVVVAVIMTLGVIRLSKQKTIVKSLNSIETLGCVQVLCADKTGTLTRNDMTLTDIVTSELHSLSSNELEQLHDEENMKQMTFNKLGGKMYSISRLMEVGTLCNNATIELDSPDGPPTGQYFGQATECALLAAAIRLGFGDSRNKFKRLSEIPFTSSTRRMVVQCIRQSTSSTSSSPMYYVKGAWEDILRDCSHYYECGLIKPKSDDIWQEYARICTTLGSQGLRVLALATGPTLDQLTFVGLVGIKNALREGIVEAIGKLKDDFHIDVKMITGDSRPTAVAVGRSLGLIDAVQVKDSNNEDNNDEDSVIISGEQLQKLLNSDMDQTAKASQVLGKRIFYRVDPIQKASIVGKLQELNKIVAMTGDGVNDVISLKRANLSLAMGSGADVCKEIADVIIVDNDLSVLLPCIIEGKGIYHKIQSFMAYQISLSLSLVILIGISFGAQLEPPLTVIQLLFINILADGPPAQSLAMEQVNERELCRWPRNVTDPLLGCHLLATLLILTSSLVLINGGLYYYLLDGGTSTTLDLNSRSLLFCCFIYCSIFTALSLRSKVKTILETRIYANKALLYCCIVVVGLSVAIVQVPGVNGFFQTGQVGFSELVYVFLYSTLVLITMDSLKVLIRLFDYLKKWALKLTATATMASPQQLCETQSLYQTNNPTAPIMFVRERPIASWVKKEEEEEKKSILKQRESLRDIP